MDPLHKLPLHPPSRPAAPAEEVARVADVALTEVLSLAALLGELAQGGVLSAEEVQGMLLLVHGCARRGREEVRQALSPPPCDA